MNTPEKNLDYEENTSVSDVHASVRREKEDPQTGLEPATIRVFAICAVFLMIGGAYLGANGGFNSTSVIPGYTPVPPEGGGAVVEEDPKTKWLKGGKKSFGNCANCHGPTGLGQPGKYPPLAASEWVTGGTERLAALILFGLSGPITVKGQAYSGEVMPPHRETYSMEQIAQVITYIRNSFGNEGSFVTTEMVELANEKYADRSGPFSAADLPDPEANLPGTLPVWAGGAPADGEAPAEGEVPAEGEGTATEKSAPAES